MDLKIQTALPSDVPALGAFARQVFFETFKNANSAENMAYYLKEFMQDEHFEKQIESDLYKTFTVKSDGSEGDQLVGYIQFYFNPDESYQGIGLELKRFYLASHLHGSGLAGKMMEFALAQIPLLGQKRAWLGVWENNLKARAFYNKWGFEEIGEHDFVTGTEVQRDLILASR